MKIAITGSESFVARELIKQCLEKGIEVLGIDVIAPANPVYEFRQGSITSPDFADLLPEKLDAIVHLAAISRDPECKNKAYECFTMNVMGTLNVMRAAQARKAKQFIFASSEWVYESFKEGEIKNEESFIDIAKHTSEYALSKLVSEANIRQQHINGFCDATVLRFAIIYGPRKSNWAAVESIMSSVKNKDEVTIGSRKSGRRFIHVQDIAAGIIASIGLAGFTTLNLSGDSLITLGDIVETSERILGKKVKVTESNPSAVSVRNPSNEKAKNVLKWQPKISLEAGLRSLLDFI